MAWTAARPGSGGSGKRAASQRPGAGARAGAARGRFLGDSVRAGAGRGAGANAPSRVVARARCDLVARARLRIRRAPGAVLAILPRQVMLQCNIKLPGARLRAL